MSQSVWPHNCCLVCPPIHIAPVKAYQRKPGSCLSAFGLDKVKSCFTNRHSSHTVWKPSECAASFFLSANQLPHSKCSIWNKSEEVIEFIGNNFLKWRFDFKKFKAKKIFVSQNKNEVFYFLYLVNKWFSLVLCFCSPTLTMTHRNLTGSCNVNCGCRIHEYAPVCGSDGITYFNPCLAGCSTVGNDSTGVRTSAALTPPANPDTNLFKARVDLCALTTGQELHGLRLRAEQTGHHSVLRRSGQPAPAGHRQNLLEWKRLRHVREVRPNLQHAHPFPRVPLHRHTHHRLRSALRHHRHAQVRHRSVPSCSEPHRLCGKLIFLFLRRSVDEQERPFALGMQFVLLRTLGM